MTQALRVGIGGPVGSGKTALTLALCKALRERYNLAVVTNDIYTEEDAQFLVRNEALAPERIIGVETGGCPHTAIREDASMNLVAVDRLCQRFPGSRVIVGDALELEALLPGERFAAVLSSLPLKVFSAEEVARLGERIRAVLHPAGSWIQYTYQVFNGHAPTAAFERVASDLVFLNLPPALVCVYQPVA